MMIVRRLVGARENRRGMEHTYHDWVTTLSVCRRYCRRCRRAILTRLPLGGIFLQRVWPLGSVCRALSKERRKIPDLDQRRATTTMATGRERIVLSFAAQRADGG